MRFNWSFYKTLEFLDSKRSNLEIKKNYFNNLKLVSDRYEKDRVVSNDWNYSFLSDPKFNEEEMVITNTFLNTRKITNPNKVSSDQQRKQSTNNSFRGNFGQPVSKRSICNETKSQCVKRVVWADQQASFVRRNVKSVGKAKLKPTACDLSFRPPSAEVKKKHAPIFIKTELEDSSLSEETEPLNPQEMKRLLISTLGLEPVVTDIKKQKATTSNPLKKAMLMDNGPSRKKDIKSEGSQDSHYKPSKSVVDYDQILQRPKFILASETEIENRPSDKDNVFVPRNSSTSSEFYRKGLKELQKKIFAKPVESITTENSRQKNSTSKVSTNVQEESSKQTPNDSDNGPAPQNISFIHTIKNINPINITQGHISKFESINMKDQVDASKDIANSLINFKSKLNKTADLTENKRLISNVCAQDIQGNLDAKLANHQPSLTASNFGKIKIQKRRLLDTFIRPSDQDYFFEEKKQDLLNKLKNLNSDKCIPINSNIGKDLSPLKLSVQGFKSSGLSKEDRMSRVRIKRPNSAPSKDEKKEQLIQKHLFFDSKNKNYIAQRLTTNVPQNQFFASKIPGVSNKDARASQLVSQPKKEKS